MRRSRALAATVAVVVALSGCGALGGDTGDEAPAVLQVAWAPDGTVYAITYEGSASAGLARITDDGRLSPITVPTVPDCPFPPTPAGFAGAVADVGLTATCDVTKTLLLAISGAGITPVTAVAGRATSMAWLPGRNYAVVPQSEGTCDYLTTTGPGDPLAAITEAGLRNFRPGQGECGPDHDRLDTPVSAGPDAFVFFAAPPDGDRSRDDQEGALHLATASGVRPVVRQVSDVDALTAAPTTTAVLLRARVAGTHATHLITLPDGAACLTTVDTPAAFSPDGTRIAALDPGAYGTPDYVRRIPLADLCA
ncbi:MULTISPECIES: hypothetical protein [Catenuloplanes]|uniref:Lipoprotein n=1 Tax=Catenuloplanes niger TaxID=587534 RepID=A0AAE3ZJZ6_9ACTN|nr:hypothetical protein [Catenuloplanes niger]MDR7320049.1 hypothetical protein [Catenuloplanes niger]